MDFRIDHPKDAGQAERQFGHELRFRVARGLTDTALQVRTALVKEMGRVFDRPTNFTLNALQVRPAKPDQLEAEVGLKRYAAKGTAATRYLSPQIEGGPRRHKRFEGSLAAFGLIPRGMYAVPGKGADLDRYGNMSRGQIVKILSALRASADPTQNLRPDGKSRGRRRYERYFVGGVGRAQHLQPGIYMQRMLTGAIVPVIVYVGRTNYRARLDFDGVSRRTSEQSLGENIERRLEEMASEVAAGARFDLR